MALHKNIFNVIIHLIIVFGWLKCLFICCVHLGACFVYIFISSTLSPGCHVYLSHWVCMCMLCNELFMNLTDICCLTQQLVGKLHGNAFHFCHYCCCCYRKLCENVYALRSSSYFLLIFFFRRCFRRSGITCDSLSLWEMQINLMRIKL